jgi:hypothetical protein
LKNVGLESVSGPHYTLGGPEKSAGGKDGWTMRTPQPEQVQRLCAFSNLFTSL